MARAIGDWRSFMMNNRAFLYPLLQQGNEVLNKSCHGNSSLQILTECLVKYDIANLDGWSTRKTE